MPLVKTIPFRSPDEKYGLYLWRITESVEELRNRARLSEEESEIYGHLKTDRRKSEWLAVRIILKEYAGVASAVNYTCWGAPLIDRDFIGISHTRGFAAVTYSPSACGVDIENISRDFSKAAGRYIHPAEKTLVESLPQDENGLYGIIWCAKETVFKRMQKTDVDFKNHIAVRSILWDEKTVAVSFMNGPVFRLSFFFFGGLLVVYG